MQLSHSSSLALALLSLAVLAPPAKASTTLTGLGDFAGITPVFVGYDSTAPTGNFSAPIAVNNTVAYNVYLKGDSTDVYGLVDSLPSQANNNNNAGAPFANLYLSTNPSVGTNVGFAVTTKGGFIPGGASGFDLSQTAYQTFTGTDANGGNVIEFSMPWTFFTADPLHMGFAKLLPGGTFQIRDSQSFGYTFVGGSTFGPTRLGQITYTGASAAPEPSQIAALGFSTFGVFGLILKARMRRKTIA